MGLFSIEGADEFSEYGIPWQIDDPWGANAWKTGNPGLYQQAQTSPIYSPEGGVINYGDTYIPGSRLDISRYRDDPLGIYRQYETAAGKTGFLMNTGRQLDAGHSLTPNLPNQGLAKWYGPNPNEEWLQLGADPFNDPNKSPWKIQEDVGQGWFSKNMDWLVPLAIGGLGGGMAASGVGMGSGATAGTAAGAAGAAEGLSAIGPAQGSILPAGLQAGGAMTFPIANPYAGIELLGAGATGGSAAEMLNQLVYSDIGPAQGEILGPGLQESGAWVNPVTANPYAGITATPINSLWDLAKKIPSMPSMPGGGMTGGAGGSGEGDGMSIWSDTVSPYGFNPVATGVPNYQAHEATPYGFEDELQRRLALIRGAR